MAREEAAPPEPLKSVDVDLTAPELAGDEDPEEVSPLVAANDTDGEWSDSELGLRGADDDCSISGLSAAVLSSDEEEDENRAAVMKEKVQEWRAENLLFDEKDFAVVFQSADEALESKLEQTAGRRDPVWLAYLGSSLQAMAVLRLDRPLPGGVGEATRSSSDTRCSRGGVQDRRTLGGSCSPPWRCV